MNLSFLISRIRSVLIDPTDEIWSEEVVEEGVRLALSEYNEVNPRRMIETLTVTSETRELDISSLGEVYEVRGVWLPYVINESKHFHRSFEHWFEQQLLYFPDYEAQAGDIARIFYIAPQLIAGLDGEDVTSLPRVDIDLLVVGAVGYAALSRGIDVVEQVTINSRADQRLVDWAEKMLETFRLRLQRVALRVAVHQFPHLRRSVLDGYESRWR